MDALWFVADNFIARTFRAHFQKYQPKNGDLYAKNNFEITPHCNSRFASAQGNMLERLQNCLAAAINGNKDGLLPKYIVVVLDDDLIKFLGFMEEGVATLLGTWMEWIAKQFGDLIQKRLEQLPVKSSKIVPFIYWVAAPNHSFFSKQTNNLRTKFNLSLESVIRSYSNMRVIKIKERALGHSQQHAGHQ